MPLNAGARLGSYEIVGAIGAGGMGEVYRARDAKLNRDVAIKIMPEALAADPVALSRFQTEAQAVAALSHPNILSIFDFGVEHGTPYAVMELLDGVTLRDVLGAPAARGSSESSTLRPAQGRPEPGRGTSSAARASGGAPRAVSHAVLPARKSIDYAAQISAGLAAAHARGITHRDLKPENIFITRDGRVKILDFGLAKVTGAGAVGPVSVLATVSPTTPGTVLGTVGYMSPEQVRGQTADHRSDIFSLGTVLYEMLSGQRAFSGPSAVETMNAILIDDPPELTRANVSLPTALDRIVRRCLEKNPEERFQSARDLGFALETLSGSSMSAPALGVTVVRKRRWLGAVVALAVIAVAVTAGIVVGRSTTAVSELSQIAFETKTFDPQAIFNARFMPDGQTIVYSAALEGNSPELFVSRPGAVAPQALGVPRTHLLSVSSKGELAVLTDARYLGHRLFRGTLARMPIDGAPRAWLENIREADWSPDGSTLAVIREAGLQDQLEYPVGKVLYQVGGYVSDLRISPDGNRVAFFEHPVRFDDRGFVKVVDREGAVRTLAGEYWGAEGLAWTPDGATILFSAADAGMDGYQPRAVSVSAGAAARLALPSVGSVLPLDTARDGRWIVIRNDDQLSIRALLPGSSVEREFPWLGSALGPSLSADGRMLLFTDQSQSAGTNYAVSLRKTDGSPAVRLGEGAPVGLSPDGTRALAHVFSPPQSVIYPVGSGEPVRLNNEPLERSVARAWFPDGKRVVVCGNEPSRPFRCYEQDLLGGRPKPLTPEGLDAGPIAPDSRTIVVTDAERKIQLLSVDAGATRPAPGVTPDDQVLGWSSDGRSLFVRSGSAVPARVERVDLATGRRTLIRELAPPDRAGLMTVGGISLVDDGRAYAYGYGKHVSRLFVVKGADTPAPRP
ncbi:MAG: hypothetical protein A3H97_20495 [Acidobacteria bacterium RIFCSPLOWO2_02_FULL_65_29]|nr:MAG: hypothetical protein A3H97_20495 [Acidobacteria bacterium RIFCSPLOWO2_02_FULL_65_29]